MSSGRGMGMGAVKSFLESQGCEIDTVLEEGGKGEDAVPFELYIWLPDKFYRRAS